MLKYNYVFIHYKYKNLIKMKTLKKIEQKTQIYLSHYPKLYALIVGIGIVLFWRGVWHSADEIHSTINYFSFGSSTSVISTPWWDGPLSFAVGTLILYITGAFTSSFIGNELILSGLRGEKKLNERTNSELQDEVYVITHIKDELASISKKLDLLESKVHKDNKDN